MLELGQLRNHIKALKTGDKPSRLEALRSLKTHERPEWATAPPELVGPLVESLRCQLTGSPGGNGLTFPPAFRQEAATILGNIGPRSGPAIPQLIELLNKDQGEVVREAAATALGKIGKEARVAVDALLNVLQPDCRGTLAGRVARALGDIGRTDDRVRSALVDLWRLPGDSLKSQAAIALCQLRADAPGLLTNLTGTLVNHRDASLRKSAAEALGFRSKNDPGVVPALAAALHDDDEGVRALAGAGLQRMHVSQGKAIELCCQQLKDVPCAETALTRFGRGAVAALIQALGAEDSTTRQKAARTLSGIGEAATAAAAALSQALHDGDWDVRLSAAKALWSISKEPEEVVPVLADLLGGKWSPAAHVGDLRRRFLQEVIEALGRIGPQARAAIPSLLEKARDENRHVLESAIRALRQIDSDAATKAGLR
jgi:HEAT repeat protein